MSFKFTPALIFLCLLAAILFAGALLSWPLYLSVSSFTEVRFDSFAIKSTQLCALIFGFIYLSRYSPLTLESIGWRTNNHYLKDFFRGFSAGVVILTLLVLSLLVFGIHDVIPGRDAGIKTIGTLLLKALLTGLLVALFEETLFRGVLFTGLSKRSNNLTALIVISFVYAIVHFIDYPSIASGETINWLTRPAQFPEAMLNMFNPATLDAALALFMLGILFGLVRIRTGNIIQCIGLHAGLVAMIKISRYFFSYQPDNNFAFLVSVHDHRLGLLAAFWIIAATLVYYVLPYQGKISNKESTSS